MHNKCLSVNYTFSFISYSHDTHDQHLIIQHRCLEKLFCIYVTYKQQQHNHVKCSSLKYCNSTSESGPRLLPCARSGNRVLHCLRRRVYGARMLSFGLIISCCNASDSLSHEDTNTHVQETHRRKAEADSDSKHIIFSDPPAGRT